MGSRGGGVDAVAEEQAFVDCAYTLLGDLHSHLTSRMASLAQSPDTGTGQDLLEKQALFDNLSQQLRSATAAESRLCFGRVDHADGLVQHIGRIGACGNTQAHPAVMTST